MYTKHFGLKKRPFVLLPDPEFLYFSREHDLAFAHLEYGLALSAGFVALTGEVGAGKTTLLKFLFNKVRTSLKVAMVFNTQVDSLSLLKMLIRSFGLKAASDRKSDLFDALYEHFIQEYAKGHRCVIVVDEAQSLSLRAFEELRMLSNLDADDDFLVQIVLVGQPQLRQRLASPSLLQLTQRISVHYHLSHMQPEEVNKYIDHRLKVAEYERSEPLFTDGAIESIANISQGIPRIINYICDASLTYAFADETDHVSRETVSKVIANNQLLLSNLKAEHAGYANAAQKTADDSWPEDGAPLDAPEGGENHNAVVSELLYRLHGLEDKVKTMELVEEGRVVEVLREMLSQERERSIKHAQKLALVTSKCRKLQSELEELKSRLNDAVAAQEPRTNWRIFGGRK